MKIAISATGPTLNDAVESRFGRCPYFLIIDGDNMEFEAYANPNIGQSGGAGIQSAQLMADKGVTVMLTGNCGPNASQTFGAAGIQVVTGVSGAVRQAVHNYISGSLAPTPTAVPTTTPTPTVTPRPTAGTRPGLGMVGGRLTAGRRGMGGGYGGGGGRGGGPS